MSYDERHFTEGISRKKQNDQFVYFYIDNGKPVSSRDLDRIRKLRIPPAWTDVWVSRDPTSAIQVIGKDAAGRKQYRYHQVHIDLANREKFLRLYRFYKALPKLENIMNQHEKLAVYDKNRVISLMLQLVKDYQMRVGKEVYAQKNKSYGISSLRKKHVRVSPDRIDLRFKGKSNQKLHFVIRDEYYVKSIKMLMKLAGDHLFQYIYIDELGNEKIKNITDRDLNKYIQDHMGSEFTIKDFRTAGANWYFLKALLNETKKRRPKNRKAIKKNIVSAFKATAKQLKHTGAVSKKSYVMDFALELYQNSPEFFVQHKNDDPTQLLLLLLRMYKKNILDDK